MKIRRASWFLVMGAMLLWASAGCSSKASSSDAATSHDAASSTSGSGEAAGAGDAGGAGGSGGAGSSGRSSATKAGGGASGGAGGSSGIGDTVVCPGETKATWVAMSTTSAPAATDRPTLLWTGTELYLRSSNAGLFDPCANTWRTSPNSQGSLVLSSPVANKFLFLWPQHSFEAFDYRQNQSLPLSLAGATQAEYATVISTGAKLIEWGGALASTDGWVGTQSGAIYNPATDAWTAMSTKGAPAARVAPGAWTGSQLAIWGGHSADSIVADAKNYNCALSNSYHSDYANKASGCVQYGDGAFYDPARDVWTPMAATGAPKPRFDHLLAWTGDRVLVWGGGEQGLPDPTLGSSGEQCLSDGGLYDPVTQTWTTVAPSPPVGPQLCIRTGMYWTGDYLVVYERLLDVWWQFDPHSNSWTTMDPYTTDPLAYCAVTMTVQAGALVAGICTIDSVRTVVLRPAGEKAWRSYPLPSDVLPDASVLWTGKRLFVWGGKIPPTYTCPAPTPQHPGCDPPPPSYSNKGYMLVVP
jgi:hypothetical protein